MRHALHKTGRRPRRCHQWRGLVDCYEPGGACALASWQHKRRRQMKAEFLGEGYEEEQEAKSNGSLLVGVLLGFAIARMLG